MKDVYSTGEVAAVCGVSGTMVRKWCDSGALPHFVVPGPGGYRRVTRAALLKFLKDNGMPFTERLGEDDGGS